MPRATHVPLRLVALCSIAVPLLACGGTTDVSAFDPSVLDPVEDTGVAPDDSSTSVPEGGAVDTAVPDEDSGTPDEDSGIPEEDSGLPDEDSGAPVDSGTPADSGPGDVGPSDTGPGDTGAPDGGDGGTVVPCSETGAVRWSGNGHCYFALTARGWAAADARCKEYGAHLVTINSSGEQSFVQGRWSNQERWIGLTRPAGPNPASGWAWVTGEPLSYTNWSPGEPNGSGLCTRLLANNGRWADQNCNTSLIAICERE